MDDIFNIVGKLYVDIIQAQGVLEKFQQQLQDKDKQIAELKKMIEDHSLTNDSNG
jgi:capsular polysaccharide biosynthesis protein